VSRVQEFEGMSLASACSWNLVQVTRVSECKAKHESLVRKLLVCARA